LLCCGFFTLIACGGGTEGPEYPKAPPKAAEAAVIKEARPPAGSIWRDELLDSLNAGLGAFLQHVEVEPSLEEGRFRGFRILQLIPSGYWDGIDLEPGDVVVSVNGLPIERETEAYAAFEALRSAKEIRIAVLRLGVAREAVVGIIEREGVSSAATTGSGASAGRGGAGGANLGGAALGGAGVAAAGAATGTGGASGANAVGSSTAGKKSK
jgi:hypothetical protein